MLPDTCFDPLTRGLVRGGGSGYELTRNDCGSRTLVPKRTIGPLIYQSGIEGRWPKYYLKSTPQTQIGVLATRSRNGKLGKNIDLRPLQGNNRSRCRWLKEWRGGWKQVCVS